ncbi:hypothetical protein SVIOM74S_05759 [Streptomyces violarus]
MNIAQHIALIDELCYRPFPAEHGPSDVGVSGPGRHTAVLDAAGDDDPALRAVTIDQYEKDRDAVYELLASRWGDTPPTTCGPSCCAPSGRRYPGRGPS